MDSKQRQKKTNPRQLRCLIATLALIAAVAGCQGTLAEKTVDTEYDSSNVIASIDFWHQVAKSPLCTNNEALHGLILFDEGKDICQTYEERLLLLQSKGYLSESFSAPANQVVQRGTVAQVLCHILKIRGGLTMRLVGPHPRYATRELMHMNLFPPCSPNQSMSGIEFVDAISKAESYQEEQS